MIQRLPLPVGTLVDVRKCAQSANPLSPACAWEEWNAGGINDGSLPMQYFLRGFLLAPVEFGLPLRILRIHRNDVDTLGIFTSTDICEIKDGQTVETFNSIYRITPANPD